MVHKVKLICWAIIGWTGLIFGTSNPMYFKLIAAEAIPNLEKYGDLYRFSNLKEFKLETPECKRKYGGKDPNKKDNIAFYALGDSFLEVWRVNEHDFNYKNFRFTRWHNLNTQIILDTTMQNVLVIETVERHLRERLNNIPTTYKVVKSYESEAWVPVSKIIKGLNILKDFYNKFLINTFSKSPEDQLEHTFFSWDIFLPIKEVKAKMFHNWFNEHNKMVDISKNKKHIVYRMDTDSSKIFSSFSPVSDTEITKMVTSTDSLVKYYKNSGFDAVVFSIIPNKTSMLMPTDGHYNHLIERFQAKAKNKFTYIDLYAAYKKDPVNMYGINETHWTCQGKNMWIDSVSTAIDKQLKQNFKK